MRWRSADDRLFPPRPGRDDGDRALQLVLDEADVVLGELWEGVVGRDAGGRRLPSLERAVDRLEVVVRDGERGERPPLIAADAVGGADRDLVEFVEDVELGQRH